MRGVDFLRRRQDPSGEFAIECWSEGSDSHFRDHAVMVTAGVLYALRFVDAAGVADIAAAAVRFLIGEMRPPGVWSYWTAASGKPIDPEAARRVHERAQQIRRKILARHGVLNVAVDLIRETRDDA